ncbi:MAG: hypothetical protein WDN44_13795 [Sphingomonas sp.]
MPRPCIPLSPTVELMHWWSSAPHKSVEETRADFARTGGRLAMLGDHAQGRRLPRSASSRRGGEAAGGNVTELGYMLAPAALGRGHRARGGERGDLSHLRRGPAPRSTPTPTLRTPRRAGCSSGWDFKLEGRVARRMGKTHIGVRDTALYGLLREDWWWLRWPRRRT